MRKKYLDVVDLIPKDAIDRIFRKATENMEAIELVLRNKRIKLSKIKQKRHAVITFEKNNIGGLLFDYGDLHVDDFGATTIRFFQEGLFKDRKVGFLKIKKPLSTKLNNYYRNSPRSTRGRITPS